MTSRPPRRPAAPARWVRGALLGTGALVMAYAVLGAVTDRDGAPVGHLFFLAGAVVAHDALLLPAAVGVGVLIGRYVPADARAAVRAAGFVTAAVLAVATPLVLGFGRRPDTPSALPGDYGRGLAITLAAVWTVTLTVVLVRRRRRRRDPSRDRPGRERPARP